jgi:hypothetical protein
MSYLAALAKTLPAQTSKVADASPAPAVSAVVVAAPSKDDERFMRERAARQQQEQQIKPRRSDARAGRQQGQEPEGGAGGADDGDDGAMPRSMTAEMKAEIDGTNGLSDKTRGKEKRHRENDLVHCDMIKNNKY